MVFFHPHERRFQIGLGIAVAVFPHDLKTILIFHKAVPAFFQFIIKLLDLRPAFSLPADKHDPFTFCDPHQIFLKF